MFRNMVRLRLNYEMREKSVYHVEELDLLSSTEKGMQFFFVQRIQRVMHKSDGKRSNISIMMPFVIPSELQLSSKIMHLMTTRWESYNFLQDSFHMVSIILIINDVLMRDLRRGWSANINLS